MADVDPTVIQGQATSCTARICALCDSLAKYACPRCQTSTCSLPCSRKHKEDMGCSGERNKAEYVPMNMYDWGTMVRDYCFLEEVGRRVGEWGSEIVRGGYQADASRRRANPRGRSKQAAGRTKRDVLKTYLGSLDIDIDLLPNGMERRKASQSTWDPKSRRPLLTIEFKFYPPFTDTLSVSSMEATHPHTILTHRNQLTKTLLNTLQSQIPQHSQTRKHKDHALPAWVSSLVHPHSDDPEGFVAPDCYTPARFDFPRPPNSRTMFYYKLDPTLPLSELLRNTHFVEYPVIHVFDRDASSFDGTVVDRGGRVTQNNEVSSSRAPKRRKVDPRAITGLLDQYGSSGSEDDETQNRDGLAMLESYSDDEDMPSGEFADHEAGHNDDPEELGSDSENTSIAPENLLELLKKVHGALDEDAVDWGDDWQDDVAS